MSATSSLPAKILGALIRGDLPSRVARRLKRRLYRPAVAVAPPDPRLRRLGSTYGGWTFLDTPDLAGATILSCGVGEDISFDVDFAAAYGAKVVLVDPTPRAVAHYRAAMAAIGRAATVGYSDGGLQPVEAYDLSRLSAENFAYVEKALWTEPKELRFYAPANAAHVSHSLRGDSPGAEFLVVDAVPVAALMTAFGLSRIPLLKLDIEGAETDVLLDLMARKILPDQILVEFDELGEPGPRSKALVEKVDRRLRENGYRLMHVEADCNFLYARVD